jgi:TPR repeat protein/AcrR family transcriptional regulator
MNRKAKRAAMGTSGSGWHKDETRAAILQAARRLLERDGADNCSLSKVAAEAEFATPAVFAYFTSKRELLTAIFSQDFAAFANGLHRSLHPGDFADEEADEADAPSVEAVQAVEDSPAAEDAMAAESANENFDFAEDDDAQFDGAIEAQSVEIEAAMDAQAIEEELVRLAAKAPAPVPTVTQIDIESAEEAPVERPRLLRRNPILPGPQLSLPRDLARDQAMEHSPEAESGPAAPVTGTFEERLARLEARRVDAWLERRLRVFERSLADLEGRQHNVESVSDGAKDLIDQTIADLKALVAESESRHRDVIKDLRNTILQVSSRLEAVEAQAHIAPDASLAVAPGVDEPEAGEHPQEPVPPQQFSSGSGSHAEPHVDGETFLSAARRAAKAAQPVNEPADLKSRLIGLVAGKGKKKIPRDTQYLLACGAALVVMMGTAGFILSQTGSNAQAAVSERFADARYIAADATRKRAMVEVLGPDRAQAELLVGLEFLTGHGKPKNEEQAAHWLIRAANEGNAVAQYRLGMLYRHGVGVAADPVLALRWYEAAALQGNRKAMHNLGIANAEGTGTPKNYAEAARWFSQAANLGYLDSEFNLGVLYEQGSGVPQSLLDAYKWYAIAAAQNDQDAQARVDVLKTQLNQNELTAAEQAANAFEPAPLNAEANDTPTLPKQTVLAISETGSLSKQ